MANDLGFTEGTGKIIGTIEKASSRHVQLLAIDFGSGTTSTPLVAGQSTMSASLPVAPASDWVGLVNVTPLATSTNALSVAKSTAYETNRVIKGSAGRLFGVWAYSNKASTQYIQFHNATSLPSDSAVPLFSVPIATVSGGFIPFPECYGDYFSTGIVICNSSTIVTKTIGSADCWFYAWYL